MATTLVSGAAFGAALVASGVHQPAAIISQLKLDNFHMLESFLTGAATSGIIVSTLQISKLTNLSPRRYTTIGLFADFDGNIAGGLLIGAGMALSGACPGTVLAQVGAGIPSGLPALSGAVVAGTMWSGFLKEWLQHQASPPCSKAEGRSKTVDKLLGIRPVAATAALETIFVTVVLGLLSLNQKPIGGLVSPVVGGLFIGAAQLVSIMLRKTTLGVSTAFEESGQCLLSLRGSRTPKAQNILFAVGVTLGAWLLSTVSPQANPATAVVVPTTHSVLGGFVVVIGALIADGCTSGHGISGTSLLSVSSLITTAAMLAGGIIVAGLMPL
ncbi:YeeE/YedE family protein [Stachybotrys elegans]|uniref:YeeE/YedE family protein n=1 Tax=Stachybotrys elegans TaxID=80388 RepID=A0A8K0SNU5_9HYPO|nr:YeeE/YedE family protein [Stachybotrys elegans]